MGIMIKRLLFDYLLHHFRKSTIRKKSKIHTEYSALTDEKSLVESSQSSLEPWSCDIWTLLLIH